MTIAVPPEFRFRRTVLSHGWCSLPPFTFDRERFVLGRVLRLPSGRIVAVEIGGGTGVLAGAAEGSARTRRSRTGVRDQLAQPAASQGEDRVRLTCAAPLTKEERKTLASQVRRMLRLDDDLGAFYDLAREVRGYEWIPPAGMGRLLRAPTVFEDLVKLLCTTNCAWSLTEVMVRNLVASLGEPVEIDAIDAIDAIDTRGVGADARGSRIRTTSSGTGTVWHDRIDPGPAAGRAFPTPEAMAAKSARFYEKEVRAGYRARALAELSEAVASGRLDPELWLRSDLPTSEIAKQILSVRGAGPYTAENLLKLLGRYEGLGLDSWTRAKFARLHGDRRGKTRPAPPSAGAGKDGARKTGAGKDRAGKQDAGKAGEGAHKKDAGEDSASKGNAEKKDAARAPRPRPVPDAAIARHYERFGSWRGLAFWCDMTRDWLEGETPAGGAGDKF